MGKASRTKRERREQGETTPPAGAARHAGSGGGLPVFWIVVGLMIVAGIVALVVTQPDDEEQAASSRAAQVPTFAEVSVEGGQLPAWTGDSSDPAEGRRIPAISAERFDGTRVTIDPDDGVARVIVTVAHWCPHCQDEVPRIVDWAKDEPLPDGIEVMALSTAVSESQPNFPPAAWLEREDWPFETLIDDEVNSGADALGVEGFPFITFVNADGTVARRYSGEMPISEFATAVEELDTSVPEAGTQAAPDSA